MPLHWIAAGRFHIRSVTRKEYIMSDKDKKKPKKKPTKLKDKLKKIK